MVAEILTAAYDAIGHPTFQPRKKPFRWFAPNAPMGRYLTQPLTVRCTNLADLHTFLAGCRYVSDREQFGRDDYWMYPEQFEVRKRGDCDDFALWTWRQLLAMGYDARFVCGRAGRYGDGHAWVTFAESGRFFLVEPAAARAARWLPRLTTARYVPALSVAWDGRTLRFYEHDPRRYNPALRDLVPLLIEWTHFWVLTRPACWAAWGRFLVRLGRSAVGAGPWAWAHQLGVIVRRMPRLWAWRSMTPRPARRDRRGPTIEPSGRAVAWCALRALGYRLPRGREILAVVGENGAGKTSLLDVLMGFRRRTSGELSVMDRDPGTDPWETRFRIAYLAEKVDVPGDWDAAEFLDFNRRFYDRYDRHEERALMDRLGLRYDARLGTMSAGETRRVQIVGALAARPDLLVADEITALLDILGRRLLLALLQERQRARGDDQTTPRGCQHRRPDDEAALAMPQAGSGP